MHDVILTVNGKQYSGWETININRGIEQIAGTFELSVTEKWSGNNEARPINRGESCTVKIDGEIVITGYVDDVLPSFDSSSHTLKISGRDKTADLVDCSAIYKTGAWTNTSLKTIAEDLCKPFGIGVIFVTDIGEPFKKVSVEQGETVFEILERLARQRGVLLTSDGKGNLVITRASDNRVNTVLKEGVNILSASGTFSNRDRYSEYIGKGSHVGDNFLNTEEAAQPTAKVSDEDVPRYRPLIIIAEDNATIDSLKKRVTWERNVRYGRSTNLSITVAGWKHGGHLWRPNKLVKVESSLLKANDELLISSVNYTLNQSGTVAVLTLKGKEAFDVLDLPEESDGGNLFS